ncbi:hypothetical protein LTR62_008283 [Meristemomyces frigidus]|uniref:Protein kinase domain-containing protein n=1 Tax=Meristemomyces frigidus TaxID=1508187 RepID=A0AAN7YH94_9PEZI|nr:hypothetical protein LTR62_008283 [Meristemomyces frigidus]
MDSYRPAHTRRSHLTKLYDDTKKSALTSINVYNRTIELFPDLQRKFRIQKDRLMTWGLTWSDDEKEGDVNIDDAVARAGLTETVDSVLRNIKDVTEEAERLANAPRALGLGGEKAAVPRNAPFDRSRYEDLIRDLTTSIDILYELSRSRKALARADYPGFGAMGMEHLRTEKSAASGPLVTRRASPAPSELTLVNPPPFQRPSLSPYAGLPPSIDISALRMPVEGPPPYESLGIPATPRLAAYLIRSKTSEGVQDRLGSTAAEVPVLVEYATFDSVYHETRVAPPLERLEALAGYLQPMRAESQTNLSLVGYFEDPSQPRIGLVYDVPYAIQNKLQATIEHPQQSWTPTSLLKLVQKASKMQAPAGDSVPALEDRFRLALQLIEQLHELHSCAIAHGNINSSSVLFTFVTGEPVAHQVRSPTWASFDLFSKHNIEGGSRASNLNIYRHPDDTRQSLHRSLVGDFKYDFYSLAVVLLEVGLWTSIGEVYKAKYTLSDFKVRLERVWIPKLAQKCGSVYMRAVEACFHMADNPAVAGLTIDGYYAPILARIRKCCALDEDSSSQEFLSRSSSFIQRTPSAPDNKISRKPVTASTRQMPLTRQHSEPTDLPHSDVVGPQSRTPRREASLPIFATTTVPSSYSSAALSEHAHVERKPSHRSKLSSSSTKSLTRQQMSGMFTSTPSFKDYKRRVTLIQRKWREHADNRRRRQAPSHNITNVAQLSEYMSYDNISTNPLTLKPTKPARRAFSGLSVPKEVVDYWEQDASPRLARLCDRALKGSKESASICVTMYGETLETARPTFLVTCKSTVKMKQMLQKYFKHDPAFCCVRVKKTNPGNEITYSRRSRLHGDSAARRTMALADSTDRAMNPDYQERPLCGASIGAYRDDEHLPPVSFGGVVLLDDTAYGMSVHHMLEHPDEDQEGGDDRGEGNDADDASETSSLGSNSDNVSLFSESDYDDESTVRPASTISDSGTTIQIHHGDLPGIHPETDYEDIDVTQPALDDAIDCDLHADGSDEGVDEDDGIDEDHLDSYKLGQVFASSGLKRSVASTQNGFKSISQSLPQEIDWALFELVPPRVHPFNIIKGGTKFCTTGNVRGDTYPVAIRQSSQLACAKVHCLGRTSGLSSGVISTTMELVKIHGRSTFSASWTVDGGFGAGGDSGAWVISNDDGRVCGHVLASKTGRTYICPMDLLLEDIRRTLKVGSVSLPCMAATQAENSVCQRAGKVMAAALQNMRVTESEVGGVALPVSPARRSVGRAGNSSRMAEPVGIVG